MSRWLHPVGQRPERALSVAGFLLLAILYAGVTFFLLGVLGTFVVHVVETFFYTGGDSIVAMLISVALFSLAYPFVLLINTQHLPRLRWATWWILLVDSCLRVASAGAGLVGQTRGFSYRAQFSAFGIAPASGWGAALVALTAAGCTLTVLALISRREVTSDASEVAAKTGGTATT